MDQRTPQFSPQRAIFIIAGILGLCLTFLIAWIFVSGALYPKPPAPDENEQDPEPVFTPIVVDTPEPLPEPTQMPSPEIPEDVQTYVVQFGDSLGYIAMEFDVSVEMLKQANHIYDADVLEVGQVLIIPVPSFGGPAPGMKLIPNSELVYSPGNIDFDTISFLESKGGYIASHIEDVRDQTMTGPEIVQLIATENSVNPRLLIAVLEYQSGWVIPGGYEAEYTPFIFEQVDEWRRGIYGQLSWAADRLNLGYYLWRVGGAESWTLLDGVQVPVNTEINAGTAAIQQFFALLLPEDEWRIAVDSQGFIRTYIELFGDPFSYEFSPLIPGDLVQPDFRLPFEDGVRWTFTGGPHGGWGAGSAWAGIDFAPFNDPVGCWQSDAWVVAMADGWITRSENGAVVQDLDDDQYEQTGWSILYMHIETRDRIAAGRYITAGEKIGHPSCEGGFSTGSHVHLARRYNGEWIPADQDLPFVMEGWTSVGYGNVYDGYMEKDGIIVEACQCQEIENTIIR